MVLTYNVALARFAYDNEFAPAIIITTLYSGFQDGLNNPAMEQIANIGPIPRGAWYIGPTFDSPLHGPFCIVLTPQPGTDTFGRSGFLIHGDSIAHAGSASHGCIVTDRKTREWIAANFSELEVV